jgi:hypothetical protein
MYRELLTRRKVPRDCPSRGRGLARIQCVRTRLLSMWSGAGWLAKPLAIAMRHRPPSSERRLGVLRAMRRATRTPRGGFCLSLSVDGARCGCKTVLMLDMMRLTRSQAAVWLFFSFLRANTERPSIVRRAR